MAASARAVQAIRAHVQSIKFPKRGPLGAVQSSPNQPAVQHLSQNVDQPRKLFPSYEKPVGSIPRGQGIDFTQLPTKYHRKPIDQIEIDYIERGGPE